MTIASAPVKTFRAELDCERSDLSEAERGALLYVEVRRDDQWAICAVCRVVDEHDALHNARRLDDFPPHGSRASGCIACCWQRRFSPHPKFDLRILDRLTITESCDLAAAFSSH